MPSSQTYTALALLLALIVTSLVFGFWAYTPYRTPLLINQAERRKELLKTTQFPEWIQQLVPANQPGFSLLFNPETGVYDCGMQLGGGYTVGVFDTGSGSLLVGMSDEYPYTPQASAPLHTTDITYASQEVVADVYTDTVFPFDPQFNLGSVNVHVSVMRKHGGDTALNVVGFVPVLSGDSGYLKALLKLCNTSVWSFSLGQTTGRVTFGPVLSRSLNRAPLQVAIERPPSWPLNALLYSVRVLSVHHSSDRVIGSLQTPLWVVFDTGLACSYAPPALLPLFLAADQLVLSKGVVFRLPRQWPSDTPSAALSSASWAQNICIVGADMLPGTTIEIDTNTETLCILQQT